MPDEEDKGHYYDGRTLQPLPIPKHAFAQAVLNTSSPCSVGLCPQYSITGAAWLKGKGKGGKKKGRPQSNPALCQGTHGGSWSRGPARTGPCCSAAGAEEVQGHASGRDKAMPGSLLRHVFVLWNKHTAPVCQTRAGSFASR